MRSPRSRGSCLAIEQNGVCLALAVVKVDSVPVFVVAISRSLAPRLPGLKTLHPAALAADHAAAYPPSVVMVQAVAVFSSDGASSPVSQLAIAFCRNSK